MSVKFAILSILREGPAYGFLIRQEIEIRTAGLLSINAGQIYTTLDRLLRDGLIAKSRVKTSKQQCYELTTLGLNDVSDWWLHTNVALISFEDLTMKTLLGSSLHSVSEDEFFGGITSFLNNGSGADDDCPRMQFSIFALSTSIDHKKALLRHARKTLFGPKRIMTPLSTDNPGPGRPKNPLHKARNI